MYSLALGGVLTIGWVLGYALKHTATHPGHIQVMRDLWLHIKA
jgi:hypothetical protein